MKTFDQFNLQECEYGEYKNPILDNIIINSKLEGLMDKNINLVTDDTMLEIMLNDFVTLTPARPHDKFNSSAEVMIIKDNGYYFELDKYNSVLITYI